MKVIQVGVGGFGGSWLHAIPECGIEHAALVDANPANLANAAAQRGISSDRLFSRLEDALANVDADALVDVTPAPFHKQTTTMALKAGLHVLCEKPMSDSMESAIEMVKAARDANRILMVTQQFRYYDQPRTIRKLIANGVIGDVDHIVAEFQIQGLLFGWRQKMRHPFLLDMAIHHFDLIRYFLGKEVVRVTAQTWNPKVSNTEGDMSAFVMMEFDGGARVNYTGSFASPGADTGWNGKWTITGSRGSIVWNSRDDWGQIRLFRQEADYSQYTEQHFFTPLPEIWGEVIPAESIGAQGHHYDLHHWRACIENGVEPETSGRDNLHTLAMTFGVMDAADSGKTVEIPQTFGL
jgi:predicted dehydrogenase